jgi:hypothetical protein
MVVKEVCRLGRGLAHALQVLVGRLGTLSTGSEGAVLHLSLA